MVESSGFFNNMKHEYWWVKLVVVMATLGTTLGACTLPTHIRGNWISSEMGTLNFTEDTLWEYPIPVTVAVQSITFRCQENIGDKYLLKSVESFLLFGFSFDAFLCLELHVISQHKYWYQVAHTIESTTQQRVFVQLEGSDVTSEVACNREEPYTISTFNTLVKEGSFEDGLIEATCPFDMFHTFSDGTLSSADATTTCSNTTLDVCEDRTQMRITYDPSCDSSLTIASEGLYTCLQYFTDDDTGVTYLHVWNNDTTLANSVKRINCYAYKRVGGTMQATLYPGACIETQNSSSVSAPGIEVLYNTITATCQGQVESGPQTLYYVGLVLGGLFVLFLIVVLICVIKKTKCHCITKHCKKTKIGHSTDSLTPSTESEAMQNYVKNARKKDIPGIFVARKPIKLGPIIEPYFQPPAKVELLYEVEPRPTSSRLMFNRNLFQSQVSLKCK